MKLGLISDIHGDPAALELALAHLRSLGVDRIVSAGDLVGYGPSPDRVVELLQDREIPSVRGNHDRWALERGAGVPDGFGGGTPSAHSLEHLAALPTELVLEADTHVGVIVHGSPASDMEFVNRRTHGPAALRRYLRELSCDFLVVGHTHQPMWYTSPSGGLVVNPGSIISLPVIDSSKTFAVVETGTLQVTFHDLESGLAVSVDCWD
jgi:putative phosphoesterase